MKEPIVIFLAKIAGATIGIYGVAGLFGRIPDASHTVPVIFGLVVADTFRQRKAARKKENVAGNK